ncbi:MAG: DsrE/DsrF/TusD sulfur relay family protein [Halanaeroarchaeum sp.]
MHIGIIVETNDPGTVWNGFRFATTALEEGHDVKTFLLGDGVEAPDLRGDHVNPHGVMVNYQRSGGELLACGTCMDDRDLEPTSLRPRSTMTDLVDIVEWADQTVTFG